MRYAILAVFLLIGCASQTIQEPADVQPEAVGQTGPENETPDVSPAEPPESAGTAGPRLMNVSYSDVSNTTLLDIYLPEGNGPFPMVVYLHGGSWVMGSREGCPHETLTLRGFAAACVDYRLSGEATFPAQIKDVKGAIVWLKAHKNDYNLSGKIGIWGESAGGHLAALAGTSAGVEALGGAPDDRVDAVVDFFGPVDFIRVENKTNDDVALAAEMLIGGPIVERHELANAANPATYASPDDPPFLIIHGDKDDMVPVEQSVILHEALRAQGVDSTLLIMGGGGHNFPAGGTEQEEMLEFFREKLG